MDVVDALFCPVLGICSDHRADGGGGGVCMCPQREASELTGGGRQSDAGYLVGYFAHYPA